MVHPSLVQSARDRFLAFRRSLPPAQRLDRRLVRVRGLELAVFTTAPVPGVPPLLCINGGLLYGHTLLWPALSPLATARQLVFYDQRGRGESKAPPGQRAARIEHDAGDVRALRETLGVSEWDVLGHSWGGGIAMLATADDQRAVRRLVLVDAVGPTGDWLPELHADALGRLPSAQRALLAPLDAAALRAPEPDVHNAYARALYPAWFADPELGRLFRPPRSDSVTGAAVAAKLRGEGYDWRDRLRAISTPTLVMHGERDLLPARVAGEIAALLRNSRVELIPDAGHMPFWEAPERFFALVEEFLASSQALAAS
jgi:proline iminopeptidase